MIAGKKIFITGGAGYLGRKMIERYYEKNDITIFSRDEAKHYYLKKQFPNVKCVIGDIRNLDLLKRASSGHDIGIFAASLKQIEAVDQNIEESIEVIIKGAVNSRRCAEENEFESACFISSDKSRSATTLYGSMKFVAGESFIVNAESSPVRLSTAIYGNVLNSTGSIIPLMWEAIRRDFPLTLYSTEMTRFMITTDEAIDLIEFGLNLTGYNVIPNIRSFRVLDLFEIFKKQFGLKYIIGSPRISEKIHEMMFSSEEAPRIKMVGGNYIMHYSDVFNQELPFNEYVSDLVAVDRLELKEMLQKYNYFKPDVK
jgi:UDP-N-acetylglucosamine 4,6-dehydratase/5-epimerase